MKDYLLEIYTEEIPARLVNKATYELKRNAEKELSQYSLTFKEIHTFGTPRRLTLYISELSEMEPDKEEEVKGPPVSIAIGDNGTYLTPFKKFAESLDVREEDVFIKELKKGKYIFAKKSTKGRKAEDILKLFAPAIIKSLHFPKPMHWISKDIKFIRPIRSILSLFGKNIVKFSYAGVEASNITYGLRIIQLKPIKIKNPADYFKKLKENYVILSYDDRKKLIEKKSFRIAQKVNGVPKYTNDFLEEVTNLNEYPTPFLAEIDKENFTMPECIIESVIKNHLKSFPVADKKGKLLPYFIGVRNGCSDFIENVKEGYEKVAKARLLDGKFFFEEDKKIPLETLVNKLSGVVFIKGLGTLKEKTERLLKLSDYLSRKINLDKTQYEILSRSAFLSKADLLTNVVREFPALQGEMGSIYAALQGEKKEVYVAIKEQYLPRFSDDKLPKTLIGTYLSIIDKIDTLVGSFIIGLNVSGSKDPYGLRRIGNSILQLLFSINDTSFPITEIIETSANVYQSKQSDIVSKNAMTFLKERASSVLKEKGIRYDVVNAVVALPIDLAPTYLKRALTIMKHLHDRELETIVLSNKRVKNILSKAKLNSREVDKELLFEKEEEVLFEALQNTYVRTNEELRKMNYEEIINLFYHFSPIISKFFDRVLVMDNNEKVRNNRLALLSNLKDLFSGFADFSRIVIEKGKSA